MTDGDVVRPLAVWLDHRRQTIELDLTGASLPAQVIWEDASAVLDVGGEGRLLGLELDDGQYITVEEPDDTGDAFARAVPVRVVRCRDGSGLTQRVRLPRRAASYELTFPSGAT